MVSSCIYKTSQDSSELNVILFHGRHSFPVSSPSYFPLSSPLVKTIYEIYSSDHDISRSVRTFYFKFTLDEFIEPEAKIKSENKI